MHKRLFNEATVKLTISPQGPILIKAGKTGADPTRPDMEFVRTWRGGDRVVYLPGSSLKGVLRAHCERIVRSIDRGDGRRPLACDPLGDDACSGRLEKRKRLPGDTVYRESCFVCQLFGNTSLAGHLRPGDAYPVNPLEVRVEERDGVAIDRVFGSVAVGPFQFEVVTEGAFQTELHLENFTLAHLGLLALTLRDLKLGRVGLGFGKSRGLGAVTVRFDEFSLRYPACEIAGGSLRLLGQAEPIGTDRELLGVGAFPTGDDDYGFPSADVDHSDLPANMAYQTNDWDEVELTAEGEEAVEAVWRACVPVWRKVMKL